MVSWCEIMSEDQEREPAMKGCEICGFEGELDSMVDCPKYMEDLEEKGWVHGWIHEGCCEESFLDDPRECMESCDSDRLVMNFLKHFKKCVDLRGLTKSEIRGSIVYMPEDKLYGIAPEMSKFLESVKPLNIVVDFFFDKEDDAVYVKDNQKHLIVYSLKLYDEIHHRFPLFGYVNPEQFCLEGGPLFLVYHYRDVVMGAMIAPKTTGIEKPDVGVEVASMYRQRYLEAEQFFGVAIQPTKEQLRAAIQGLSEDELIDGVLCPLLTSLGFQGVKAISFHGPGESGGDFYPFYKTNEFGKIVYYSAQAKAVKIHSKAGIKEGNVNQLIDQVKKLFRTTFISFIDNAQKRISYAFVFSSQGITPEAQEQLFYAIENRQTVSFVDVDEIVSTVLEKGLSDQVLNYCRSKGKKTSV